jgi:hypothetical protein
MALKCFVSDSRMRVLVPVQAVIDPAQDVNNCIRHDEALDSSLLCFPSLRVGISRRATVK